MTIQNIFYYNLTIWIEKFQGLIFDENVPMHYNTIYAYLQLKYLPKNSPFLISQYYTIIFYPIHRYTIQLGVDGFTHKIYISIL